MADIIVNPDDSGAAAPAATPTIDPAQQKIDTDIADQNAELKKLSPDELVEIIRSTRSEAKTRRLKAKELETKIEAADKKSKLDAAVALEKNSEFEKLYTNLKTDTGDYEDLKKFKTTFLEDCQEKVETHKKELTVGEVELFDLSAKGQTFDNQLKIIVKMIDNKKGASQIDTAQSTYRTSGVTYTKEDLLKDTKLMAEVKEKNPTLYEKFFGKFK